MGQDAGSEARVSLLRSPPRSDLRWKRPNAPEAVTAVMGDSPFGIVRDFVIRVVEANHRRRRSESSVRRLKIKIDEESGIGSATVYAKGASIASST